MKDASDHADEPLPARRPSLPPMPPPPAEPLYDEPEPVATPAGKKVSARLIARALRRYWWQAFVVWVVGSVALVMLAYFKVKPTFDAASQIRVDINRNGIFDQSGAPTDQGQFMKSQVAIITSPRVSSAALVNNPKLLFTSVLRGSTDPGAELRRALRVGIIPGTNFIQVELSSKVPAEAAELVNAVVDAYLKEAKRTYGEATEREITLLKEIRDQQAAVVDAQRKEVQDISERLGAANEEAAKDRSKATIEAYREMLRELTRVEIMRIAAKTKLDRLRDERTLPVRSLNKKDIEEATVTLFYSDPVVSDLEGQLSKAETKLDEVKRLARSPSEPSVVHALHRVSGLKKRKDELWVKMEPRLRRQLTLGPAGDDSAERAVKEAELNFSSIVAEEEALREKLDKLKIENNTAESNSLKMEFARGDLQQAQGLLDDIKKRLHQRELEAKHPVAEMSCQFPAAPTSMPNADRRTQIMAATPVLFGMILTALLVLLELRGARVGDPDDLAHRVKLQVIGVVPPLPQIRAAGAVNGGLPAVRGDLRAQRQLDEFVQSLDHLRVALCARPDPWGRDRHCVLITSACGSEGKTTLAAQLAERCVNAGLMTLLVDADLRNPTLSRMLDAQDNPGLINVLRGDLMAEDVIIMIGEAGGFHLLPAGTPRVDPSRLLQGDRLGKLLAQARESFDMIIIDAPPVLPVPDALTIGRWADGAVLAVRYDTSRLPLVERANRRLAHVGVPVIGAVVNGVRTMEASYGGYYAYGYGGYGTVASAAPAPVADE